MSRHLRMAPFLVIGAFVLVGGHAALLTALPALLLVSLLLSGRFVGERVCVRRLGGRRAPRRRVPRIAVHSRVVLLPVASALLGLARGLRGPPLAVG